MSRMRIEMDRLQDLVRYHREGGSQRQISKLLRMGRNTVEAYASALATAGLLEGDPAELPELDVLRAAVGEHAPPRTAPQHVSSVDRWADDIMAMVKLGAKPRAIFDCLRMDRDKQFTGTYPAIKRYCRRLAATIHPEDVAIPIVPSPPGERAQVDFGYVGQLYDPVRGVLRRAWVFVMVLSHSRHLFAKVVFDQKVETWLSLHVEAFAWFGGIVRIIMPDNLHENVYRHATLVWLTSTISPHRRQLFLPIRVTRSRRGVRGAAGRECNLSPPSRPRACCVAMAACGVDPRSRLGGGRGSSVAGGDLPAV